MTRRQKSRDAYYLLAIVAAVVSVATLYFAKDVLIPFALAVLFTFILAPVVRFLERSRMGRVPAALAVVVLCGIAAGAVGWTVTTQLGDVVTELPKYRGNIKAKLDSFRGFRNRSLTDASKTVQEIGNELAGTASNEKPGEAPSKLAGTSRAPSPARPVPVEVVPARFVPFESVQNVLGILGTVAIVIVFTIFMLIQRESLRNRLISLAGDEHLNVMTQALDEAAQRVSRYLMLQVIVNTSYGLIIGAGLYFIGIPGALLWGVIVGLLRFLPYVGPPLGAIVPVLLSIAIFDGWHRLLMTLGLFVTTELLIANALEPVLYGSHTGISSIAILMSAVFWTALWGPIGLVLSTPLTVCLLVLGRHVPRLHFLNVILGDQPALAPESQYYQRLLAMDYEEARGVLEANLKENNLEQLYDSVLILALGLAERDRHSGDLDEDAEKFVFQTTKELVEEFYEQSNRDASAAGVGEHPESEIPARAFPVVSADSPRFAVVCVPARDEADEIAGTMLAQLLTRAGFEVQALPIGPAAEMLEAVARATPQLVCISALPPFAISHARLLYRRLKAQSPNLDILVGLWNFTGDIQLAAKRTGITQDGGVYTTLAAMLQNIRVLREIPRSNEVGQVALRPSDAAKRLPPVGDVAEILDFERKR